MLRSHIESRAPDRLDEITNAVTTAVAERYGPGPIDAPMQAILFESFRPNCALTALEEGILLLCVGLRPRGCPIGGLHLPRCDATVPGANRPCRAGAETRRLTGLSDFRAHPAAAILAPNKIDQRSIRASSHHVPLRI